MCFYLGGGSCFVVETVIERIFYDLERGHQGRIYLKEWKKSKFVSILEQLDEEDDINRVLEFFSYEHFYVLYCKFWELDQDHDFFISKDVFRAIVFLFLLCLW